LPFDGMNRREGCGRDRKQHQDASPWFPLRIAENEAGNKYQSKAQKKGCIPFAYGGCLHYITGRFVIW
jgi:hypothetical protein